MAATVINPVPKTKLYLTCSQHEIPPLLWFYQKSYIPVICQKQEDHIFLAAGELQGIEP